MRIGVDGLVCAGKLTGVGNYLLGALQGLAKLDHVNEYVIYYPSDTVFPINLPNNFKLRYVSKPKWISNGLWHLLFSSFYVNKDNLDIFWATSFIPRFIDKGIKKILSVYDLFLYTHKNYCDISQLLAKYLLYDWSVMNTDCCIPISEFTKTELLDCYSLSEEQIHVIYPGVELSKDIGISDIRNKFKISGKYILSVGTIEARRDSILALKLAKCLEKNNIDLKVVIVGKLHDKRSQYGKRFLRELLNCNQNVLYLDYVSKEDLNALYREAQMYLALSTYEGFGIPPVEALLHGKKVLVSDIQIFREILGDEAEYIKSREPEMLMIQLSKILSSLDDGNSAKRSRPIFDQKYSWNKFAERFLDVIGV